MGTLYGMSSPNDNNGATIIVPFKLVNRAQVAIFLHTLKLSGPEGFLDHIKVEDKNGNILTGTEALEKWDKYMLEKVVPKPDDDPFELEEEKPKAVKKSASKKGGKKS